ASPMQLYTRLFGPGFADPNKADFTPDPEIMIRHSVLSGVTEDRSKLASSLGAADKARLDQYFTSIRQLENQLALQLQKPAPNDACLVPARPQEQETQVHAGALEIGTVQSNHRIMSKLLA